VDNYSILQQHFQNHWHTSCASGESFILKSPLPVGITSRPVLIHRNF
jgi:hypothetical protein